MTSAVKVDMPRRYAAEFVGTFGIVFVPVALSATGSFPNSDHGLLAAALASGLSVLAMVYALGHISAAHFNPAVSLGFAVSARFPWRYVLPYWIAQISGATSAAGLVTLLFGAGYGVHIPAPGPAARAVALEAALTFLLMLVIIAVATDRRVNGAVPGLAIGLTVVCDVLIGGPVTGGSMKSSQIPRTGAVCRWRSTIALLDLRHRSRHGSGCCGKTVRITQRRRTSCPWCS